VGARELEKIKMHTKDSEQERETPIEALIVWSKFIKPY